MKEDIVFCHVSMPRLKESLDQFFHRLDEFPGTRLMCGIEATQPLYVPMGNLVGALRQLTTANAPLARPRLDIVINVRDVAHVSDLFSTVDRAQQTEKNVKDDDRPRVPDRREVVNRRAAHIHAHASGIERSEYPLL